MENYNLNINWGTHTILITLQQFEYIGHLTVQIGGNCKGRQVLDFNFEYYGDERIESDCDFKYDEENEIFYVALKNKNGEISEFEGNASDFNDMIVGLEILDYVEERED